MKIICLWNNGNLIESISNNGKKKPYMDQKDLFTYFKKMIPGLTEKGTTAMMEELVDGDNYDVTWFTNNYFCEFGEEVTTVEFIDQKIQELNKKYSTYVKTLDLGSRMLFVRSRKSVLDLMGTYESLLKIQRECVLREIAIQLSIKKDEEKNLKIIIEPNRCAVCIEMLIFEGSTIFNCEFMDDRTLRQSIDLFIEKRKKIIDFFNKENVVLKNGNIYY